MDSDDDVYKTPTKKTNEDKKPSKMNGWSVPSSKDGGTRFKTTTLKCDVSKVIN